MANNAIIIFFRLNLKEHILADIKLNNSLVLNKVKNKEILRTQV